MEPPIPPRRQHLPRKLKTPKQPRPPPKCSASPASVADTSPWLKSHPAPFAIARSVGGRTIRCSLPTPCYEGGANAPSLLQAQEFYRTIGVSDPHLKGHERSPRASEMPPDLFDL